MDKDCVIDVAPAVPVIAHPVREAFANTRARWGIVATLFAAHAVLGILTIRALSPTFDEPVHLAAGYLCLKSDDYRLNTIAHPPAAEIWSALPLLAMKPSLPEGIPFWLDVERLQYSYADVFFYGNRVDAERLLHAGRLMTLLLSLGLGVLVFRWSREMYGYAAAIVALALWAFLPAFVAHGTLVTTDMAMTLGYAATVYAFWHWWKSAGRRQPGGAAAAAVGVCLGLLLSTKYSAPVIFPVLGVILAHAVVTRLVGPLPALRQAILALAVAAAVVVAVYRFNALALYYWPGFKSVLAGVTGGRGTFLLGSHSTTGFLAYFPVVLLLKTPLPLLLMVLAAALMRRSWNRESVLFLVLPAALYFALSCLSKLQIGHRHILPVYPFLVVWAASLFSRTAPQPQARGRWRGFAVASLLFWLAAGTLRVHPWHLSYFNEIVGSSDRGYRYLSDSDVDWGQGLKALAAYLRREGIDGVYLCYFGNADPGYYGIRYWPVAPFHGMTPEYQALVRPGDPAVRGLPRTVLAISATNLQGIYYRDKELFSYLKATAPKAIVASSILVYDLDEHPAQLRRFQAFLASVERG